MHNIKVTEIKLHLKFETVITHACMDNKTPILVCDFPKPLTVISMNYQYVLGVKIYKGPYIGYTSKPHIFGHVLSRRSCVTFGF